METPIYTYEDAFAELQQIVSNIESAEIGIDQLADQIRRASDLIEICKAKLHATEAEVESLIQKLLSEEDLEIVEENDDSEEE